MCLGNFNFFNRLNDIADNQQYYLTHLIDDNSGHGVFDYQCPYIDPDNISSLVDTNPSKLNIIQLNIHSLHSKLDDLKLLVEKLNNQKAKPDIIMLCETFLNDNNISLCKIPGYRLIEKHRINCSRGGVALLVSSDLSYTIREDLTIFHEGIFESCFIEIKPKSKKSKSIIVGEIYRVPGTCVREFLLNYSNLIDKIAHEKSEIILGMDQNLDYIKVNTHKHTSDFLDLNLNQNLCPAILRPTRITHSSATLIDNIYLTPNLGAKCTSAILTTHLSDHLPCFVSIDCSDYKGNHGDVYWTRNLSNRNIEQINLKLSSTDWSPLNNMDTHQSYAFVINSVKSILNEIAPETKVKRNPKLREPWMTESILKSSKKCDSLYKTVIRLDRSDQRYKNYILYRNNLNYIKRRQKQTYYKNKVDAFCKNSKLLWQLLKTAIGKSNDKSSVTDNFKIDGHFTNDPVVISNKFNEYFSTIGHSFATKVPNSHKNFSAYLPKANDNTMFLHPTDPTEILKLINGLSPKLSAGEDGISNKFLKLIANSIIQPLNIVFNRSLQEGSFPDNMKMAEVNPIFKNNDRHLLANYRPISLLPVVSKILEKIVHKRLYSFLTRNNLINPSQYGFRPNCSTTHAVLEFLSNIIANSDRKQFSLGLFLDLSRAFDSLHINTLLYKLSHYGIRGHALTWFASYLKDRKMCVKFNNTLSTSSGISYGIPQGSVLGPLLFLIYVNDLNLSLRFTSAVLFADDTNLFITNNRPDILLRDIKSDLSTLIDWFRSNKLTLNISKTNCLLFSPKRSTINKTTIYIPFGSENVTLSSQCKFLGLIVDDKLSWEPHIRQLVNKINKNLFLLRSVKNMLPSWSKRLLYHSYIHCHFTYALIAWGPSLSKAQINRMFKLQKKAIRYLDNATYNAHTSPLFKKYKILKFEDLIKLELLKFGFSYNTKALPQPIMDIFHPNSYNHLYNTRQCNFPRVHSHSTKMYNSSFLAQVPIVWQNTSNTLQRAPNLNSLIRQFKNQILDKY